MSPLAKRTAAFSSAATAATQQTENAYGLVERTYYEVQVARLVRRYDTAGFDPAAIHSFLPEKDREVRTEVLRGLLEYAQLLADVSGDRPLTEVDEATQHLATALQGVSAKELSAAHLTAADTNTAVLAVNVLGHVLIERKRRRELPAVLHAMQKPILTICGLLEADIGESTASAGLRNQLQANYDQLLSEQKDLIALGKTTMPADERRDAIRVLPQMVSAERTGDAALAATHDALAELAKAHSALAETAGQKDSPSFRVALARLVASAQQLQRVYQNLPGNA